SKVIQGQYLWLDNSSLVFTNWEQPPRNKANYCLEMEADESRRGKWIGEPCDKENLVVCQHDQPWSNEKLQKALLDVEKRFQERLQWVKKENSDLKNRLEELVHDLEHSKNQAVDFGKQLDESKKQIASLNEDLDKER